MWPSTTKVATPTSSQDDRRRPFIVIRLVSGQHHVKRAGRRSDPSELTRLDQVDEHVPFLLLENRKITGLADADLVAGDLDLRAGGARRAQGHLHAFHRVLLDVVALMDSMWGHTAASLRGLDDQSSRTRRSRSRTCFASLRTFSSSVSFRSRIAEWRRF